MMNKRPLLAVAAAALMVCGSAQAEFLIGGQVGFSESDGAVRGNFSGVPDELADEESGGVFSVFGQYRHTLSNGFQVGAHLGWGSDSTEWKGEGAYKGLDFEASDTIDLLGLVAFPGERVKPLMMFGYSSVEIDGSVTAGAFHQADSATLAGYKLAVGAEFLFGENWLGHLLLHYADYGDEELVLLGGSSSAVTDEMVEMTQTGIRFGVAYRF